jgi:3-dehydroquinate synthase
VLIVSNVTVAPLYLDNIKSVLTDFQCHEVILPDGEAYKTLEILNLVFDSLLQNRLNRQVTVVALGGGVIGDMAGFAAACYQRGVPFIQVPTTLLSQVDSSVGGKTGVNHALGKNMIGAFYQPQCVVIDTNTLNTLDDRQLSAGIAEVIKYGLINDLEFFVWLENNMQSLLNRNPESLRYAIKASCQNKANVVAEDEKEAGVRALLNLGHTFGHAIETNEGYGTWLHGEAVSIGLLMAAILSYKQGWITEDDKNRVQQCLASANLPYKIPEKMNADDFIKLMSVDKKVKDGVIRLVLMKSIGESFVTSEYDHSLLIETLNGV